MQALHVQRQGREVALWDLWWRQAIETETSAQAAISQNGETRVSLQIKVPSISLCPTVVKLLVNSNRQEAEEFESWKLYNI